MKYVEIKTSQIIQENEEMCVCFSYCIVKTFNRVHIFFSALLLCNIRIPFVLMKDQYKPAKLNIMGLTLRTYRIIT